jgi:hypothetical protein
MNQTFEVADIVLVLDEEVEACGELDKASAEEQLLRILCSSWMRRLWTLQEAVHTRKLYVRHRDGFLDVHAAFRRVVEDVRAIDFPYSTLRVDIARCFRSLLFSLYEGMRPSERFVCAWNAALFRTTSKEGDDMLVLAGLLHVDTAKIFNAPVNERLRLILSSLSVVPKDIMFHGSPVNEHGCRWMMVNSFTRSTLPVVNSHTEGRVTPDGLVVTGSGFMSVHATANIQPLFYLLDVDSGRWCQVVLDIRHMDFRSVMRFDSSSPLALLTRARQLDKLSTDGETGVLVRAEDAGRGVIKGTLVSRVFVLSSNLRYHSGSAPLPDFPKLLSRYRKRVELGLPPINFPNVLLGSLVGPEQKWCVG